MAQQHWMMENRKIIGAGMGKGGRFNKGAPQNPAKPNQIPDDLDYIRIELEPQYKYLQPRIDELFGKTPGKDAPIAPIYLLGGAGVFDIFNPQMEQYNASHKLLRRCDTHTQSLCYTPENGGRYLKNVPCESVERGGKGCDCVGLGKLAIFVPALGALCYFSLTVKSKVENFEFLSFLMGLYEVMEQAGIPSLAGIPFELGRTMREQTAPEMKKGTDNKYHRTGNNIRVKRSLLYLKVHRSIEERYVIPARTRMMLEQGLLMDVITGETTPVLVSGNHAQASLPAGDSESQYISDADYSDYEDEPVMLDSEELTGQDEPDETEPAASNKPEEPAPHWASDEKNYNDLIAYVSDKYPNKKPGEVIGKALALKRNGDKNLQQLIVEQYQGSMQEAEKLLNTL